MGEPITRSSWLQMRWSSTWERTRIRHSYRPGVAGDSCQVAAACQWLPALLGLQF